MRTAGMTSTGLEKLVGAGPLDRYRAELELRARATSSKTLVMMASVLRQLEKAQIISNDNFHTLIADAGRLTGQYEEHLRHKGNRDMRTARSRLRALIDDYRQQVANYDDLDFSETFRALVRARYGELSRGKGRATTGITFTLVARDISHIGKLKGSHAKISAI